VIEEIVKAGILAPSAKNRQPWKYIVYTGASKEHLLDAMERGLVREKFGKALLPESAFGLPDAFHTLQIMREAPVTIIILNENGRTPYENIGTENQLVGAVALGVPDEEPASRPRKQLEDVLEYR